MESEMLFFDFLNKADEAFDAGLITRQEYNEILGEFFLFGLKH